MCSGANARRIWRDSCTRFWFFWLSLFSLRKVFDSDGLIKSTFIWTTFLTWSLRKLPDEGGSNASWARWWSLYHPHLTEVIFFCLPSHAQPTTLSFWTFPVSNFIDSAIMRTISSPLLCGLMENLPSLSAISQFFRNFSYIIFIF